MKPPFGLRISPQREGYVIERYGHRYWVRSFKTVRTARKWLERAVDECHRDKKSGLHFAPKHIRDYAAHVEGWAP